MLCVLFFIFIEYFQIFHIFLLSIYRLERSKVRVSFYQSSQPQSISPPADTNLVYFGGGDNNNILLDSSLTSSIFLNDPFLTSDDTMSAAVAQPASYDRQIR